MTWTYQSMNRELLEITITVPLTFIFQVGDNAFQSLKKLRELRLEFNFLSKISESLLRRNLALKILYLDNNQIRYISIYLSSI